ncbi:MAG: hypothetical protein CSMARM5_0067 [Candidatus Parvarchaeum acidophilus ARMAN-5_'5-way FS']|jgi:energy-coupling factor transporter transmembrane protein EcfT|nr:MAG: hypothetical protein CSMARM5_0067 [Candidatus Parvarchaeum acidophilus ARMAN-5_'5-way FS']
MIKSLFLIGFVVFVIGVIGFSGLTIKVIGSYVNRIFSYIPIQQQYSAIIFIIIGFILMGLSFNSKMGKYYKYY